MSSRQTDNSFLWDKIKLRLNHIPMTDLITVFDAYGGDGHIWNKIKERYPGEIQILRCDQKNDKRGAYIRGDNLKVMKGIDLSKFSVIDLDAYGYPYLQLKEIFRQYRCKTFDAIVFVTAIQTHMGNLPHGMLEDIGYTRSMIKKCHTLFSSDGLKKLKHWLGKNGVTKIWRRSSSRKHYLCFELKKT